MRLAPDQIIAGVSARALRDCLKKQQNSQITRKGLAEQLGLTLAAASCSVDELVKTGCLAPQEARPWDAEQRYELTTTGRQLANVSFAARFSRKKAESLLAEVVANAERINSDGDLTHRVTEMRAFGSYLTDAEDLGDLDIAFALTVRYPDRDLLAMSYARAEQSGKGNLSTIQRMFYGETEVTKLIRGRKYRVSLHDLDELVQLGIEGVRVFPPAVQTD